MKYKDVERGSSQWQEKKLSDLILENIDEESDSLKYQ